MADKPLSPASIGSGKAFAAQKYYEKALIIKTL
jgi:hypothetical protein